MLHCRWLVGVSYRIITYKDPVPSLERGKRAIAQLAPVPGAIYLSRGSMTSDGPGVPIPHILQLAPNHLPGSCSPNSPNGGDLYRVE